MIYKITNLTDLLNKRDVDYNRKLTIDYLENMTNKKIDILPKQSTYIKINNLSLTAHKLRVKGLISVVEITEDRFNEEYEKMKIRKNKTTSSSNKKTINNVDKSNNKKNTRKRKPTTSKKSKYNDVNDLDLNNKPSD